MRTLWLLLTLIVNVVVSVALAAPALTSPASAQAGSKVTFQATGSGDPRDFVTIVPKGAPEGKYDGYFEVRLLAAESPYKTLVSRPIKITAATASVKGPASAAAGSEISVEWTGPGNDRDYVAIGETGPGARKYLDYKYTNAGSPLKLEVPEKPGTYEIRYLLGEGDTIIARQTLTVGAVTATLSAPTQVAAGASFQVTWTGPSNERDFVTMVKAGAAEKSYERYQYTAQGNSLAFQAPDVPGAYELRYATGNQYLTLARAAVTVTAVTGSLTAPVSVVAGETFKVSWKGPDAPRNFITVVPKGAKQGSYGHYFYTTPQQNPGSLVAPLTAGAYEVRYATGEKYLTLAKADLTVTPAKDEPGLVKVTLSTAANNGAIEIILDASGSMLQKLGAERRIDIAKRTLNKLVGSTIPAGTPFAFRVFGREVDSCQTDLEVPISPLNRTAVQQRIGALVAKNGAKTPIGESLVKAADDLKRVTGERLIVLVTDGEETCGGDPAAAIANLRKAGVTTRVSIVGFALEDATLAATFRRWADAGSGAFFDAKDAAALDKALAEALRPSFEVVNAQGQVLARGIVGGDAVTVPSGNQQVRIKGRASSTKPVVVKPKETATVSY
jgi:hypothetical protein